MLLFLCCHCYVQHISYTYICDPWHLRSFPSGGFLQVELVKQSPEISLRCLNILSRCCPGRKFHFISAVHNNEFPYYKLLNFAEKEYSFKRNYIFTKMTDKCIDWYIKKLPCGAEKWFNGHKSVGCSSGKLRFESLHLHGCSQLSITLVLAYLTFSVLHGNHEHMWCTKKSKQSTHANKINLHKFIMIITCSEIKQLF